MELYCEQKSSRHIAAYEFLSSISLDGKSDKKGCERQPNAEEEDLSRELNNYFCGITRQFELPESTSEGYPKRSVLPLPVNSRIAKISESSISRFKLESSRELISADTISELFNIINEPASNERTHQYSRKIKPSNR